VVQITNIVRRSDSNRWYYRRAFPEDVMRLLGKKEFMKSLRTADQTEARARATKAEFEFMQMVNAARRQTAPDADEVHTWMIELFEREFMELKQTELARASGRKDPHLDVGPMNPHYRERLVRTANTGESNGACEWAVDEAIAKWGWKVDEGSDHYADLLETAAQALLEARNRIERLNAGNWDETPSSPKLKAALAAQSKAGRTSDGMMDIFELYAKEQGHLRADTVDQNRKMVRRFAEFVGETAAVADMTRANARDWKFKLREFPKKASEIREFRGLDFHKVLEANKFAKRDVIDERSVAKYLAALGSFGQWLVRHGYIDESPTAGLMPPKGSRSKASTDRRPFTTDELNALFASPVFSTCGGDRREHVRGDVAIRDERYWLFPLALFTGARQAELCQLRRRHVRQQDGAWLIDIVEDGDETLLKSSASARAVPIHPELIQLGFIDWVLGLGSDRDQAIFPRCKRNARGQFGETAKWLGRYMTKVGVKTDAALTFHSFRHTFIDALRRADLAEAEIQPLVGHAPRTVTRGYGREQDGTIRRRRDMIKLVGYPGLVLPRRSV